MLVDVVVHELLAEGTVAIDEFARTNADALLDEFIAEVSIAGNRDGIDDVFDPQLHVIENGYLFSIVLCKLLRTLVRNRRVGDLSIEIALALVVASQILRSFIEQILIDCAFLINGQELPERALCNFCALDPDIDRPALRGPEKFIFR